MVEPTFRENVTLYDYEAGEVKRYPVMDAFVVAEAWVYNKDKSKSIGYIFLVSGPDVHSGVTMADAIKRAREERERLIEKAQERVVDIDSSKAYLVRYSGEIIREA